MTEDSLNPDDANIVHDVQEARQDEADGVLVLILLLCDPHSDTFRIYRLALVHVQDIKSESFIFRF